MRYEERTGESKLHVVRDGLRFLRTILEMTLMWRPARLFVSAAVICLILMVLLASHPMEMWLRLGRLEEDMIYRLLFCSLLGTFGVTLLSCSVLSDNLHRLWDNRKRPRTFLSSSLDRLYSFTGFGLVSAAAVPTLAWLVGPGLWTRLARGYVQLHWSRVVLAGLIAFGLGQMLASILIANMIRFHTTRKALRRHGQASDPVSAAARTLRNRPVSVRNGSSPGICSENEVRG